MSSPSPQVVPTSHPPGNLPPHLGSPLSVTQDSSLPASSPNLPSPSKPSTPPGFPAEPYARLNLAVLFAGGGILVAEMVLEEKPAARGSLPASLNLLVRTQGRERSLPEYRRLLEQHGFCDVQLAHVGDGLDVILGTRASPP